LYLTTARDDTRRAAYINERRAAVIYRVFATNRAKSPGDSVQRLLIGLFACFATSAAYALDRYVATTGADVGDCSAPGSPCLTLQYAINQSAAGDTIHVAAGTYGSALVLVNKTLTLLGAQAGVDARSRAATESILSNTSGMSVSASNVIIDGFTIQDSTTAAFTGFGLLLNSGVDGTQVVNNIIQNNIVGLGLANGGTTQAVVMHNHFKTNNQPGSSSGTAIYSDIFVSGTVSNVLIDANAFDGNANAGVGLNGDTASIYSNITITNNAFDSNGRGIYALFTASILIRGNALTNTSTPTDGGQSSAISAFGAVTGMSILNNHLQGGAQNGIRIIDAIGGSPNTGIEAHQNDIVGFATAGLVNQDTAQVNATCNWWGAASGPTNPANPGGTGDVVTGPAAFAPWLVVPAIADCPRLQPVPTLSPLAILLMVLALAAIGFATLARSARR
jgi:hypothetical protein